MLSLCSHKSLRRFENNNYQRRPLNEAWNNREDCRQKRSLWHKETLRAFRHQTTLEATKSPPLRFKI